MFGIQVEPIKSLVVNEVLEAVNQSASNPQHRLSIVSLGHFCQQVSHIMPKQTKPIFMIAIKRQEYVIVYGADIKALPSQEFTRFI